MWRVIKRLAAVGLVLLAMAITAVFGREYIRNYFLRVQLTEFLPPSPGKKVLIIAPHCDDETLGAGALIARLKPLGVQFKVVLMTNGDGFTDSLDITFHEVRPSAAEYIRFGYLRQTETKAALQSLGLSEQDIVFLGYPDGGTYALWNDAHWLTPYQSQHTKVDHSPYTNSLTPNVPYTGASVVQDLERIMGDYRPDYVIYPHPNDNHPDHLAAFCFTKYALNQMQMPVQEVHYLVHRGDWPIINAHSNQLFLVPPASLINRENQWQSFDLQPDETNRLGEAIRRYHTQIHVMEAKLLAFARKNQLFSSFADGQIEVSTDIAPVDYRDYLLTLDPVSDALLPSVQGGGDIRNLYGYADQQGNLHFVLEARQTIASDVKYTLDMFAYYDISEQCRLVVSYRQQTVEARVRRGNSVEEIVDVTVVPQGKLLLVTIPSRYLQETNRLFLGATSSVYSVRLDRLAWRTYSLQSAKVD